MTGMARRNVRSGDVELHCEVCGDERAPMVLLLHGFPARWSSWRHVMERLAATHFVVAPDLRGAGESDKPRGRDAYSIARFVEDNVAIIDAFGRERAFLAGHDFGGGVAWATTMFHPERIEKLGIVNSVHPVGFERQMRRWSQLKKSWYVFMFLLPYLPEWWLSRNDHSFLKRSLLDDGLSEADVDDLMIGMRMPGALHAMIDWYRASFRDGVAKRFTPRKVETSTLVIWGDREPHFDATLANPPEDWVTNARVEHLSNAGHWPPHEAPAETSELLAHHFVSA
jgi:pimeloyl-ACP methyl ester carboxylesterase